MISIKEAKARTHILKTFLKEQGVELPHGVVLEAIARLEHHKNWASLLVSAKSVEALTRAPEEIETWPSFVFFFDIREQGGSKQALYVMPFGTALFDMDTVNLEGVLDDDSGTLVPNGFGLDANVVVTGVHSSVSDIAKHGMPRYADERAAAFFREELGCAALDVVDTAVTDSWDDTPSRFWFAAKVEPTYAKQLLCAKEVAAPAVLTEVQLTEAAYERVFSKVFCETNDQPVARIMDSLHKGTGIATNAEAYLRRTVDALIELNGPYDLLTVPNLMNYRPPGVTPRWRFPASRNIASLAA